MKKYYLIMIIAAIVSFQNCAEKQLEISALTDSSKNNNNNDNTNDDNNNDNTAPNPFMLVGDGLHNCYLKDGGVKCWGLNGNGEVGDGTSTNRSTPTQVLGMDSNVTYIDAGTHVSCAVKESALYCWGWNANGQLGNGTAAPGINSSPIPVLDMDAGVTKVSVGGRQVCALKDGALFCWGENRFGTLGIGNTNQQNRPATVIGMNSGVTDFEIGQYYGYNACAVKFGALYCWGENTYGQVGDGTNVQRNQPVLVSGMESDVTDVALGNANACAIKSGSLYCWGYNEHGQAGVGDSSHRSAPVKVSALDNKQITKLSMGGDHTCAIASGAVYCWGRNENGPVGTGNTVHAYAPVRIVALDGASDILASGLYDGSSWGGSSLAILNDKLISWGHNVFGQLANGSFGGQLTAPQVAFSF